MKNEEKLLSDEELDEVNGGLIPNIPSLGVSFDRSKFDQKLRNAQVGYSGVIGHLPDDEELEEGYDKALVMAKHTTERMLGCGKEAFKAGSGMPRIE